MTEYATPAVPAGTAQEITWLVDRFAARVPEVLHAVLVASDGLLLAASEDTDRDLGERLSAATTGLLSLARHSGEVLRLGRSEALTVRLAAGHLLAMRAGEAACLMVAVSLRADLRVVADEMLRLVDSVGPALTSGLRTELGTSATSTEPMRGAAADGEPGRAGADRQS